MSHAIYTPRNRFFQLVFAKESHLMNLLATAACFVGHVPARHGLVGPVGNQISGKGRWGLRRRSFRSDFSFR